VRSLLPAILLLAAVDSLNPASITGAIYLAGSGPIARLRPFLVAVYSTYLSFGLALMLGPSAALQSALSDSPTILGPAVDVAVGGLLVGMGICSWRRRPPRRRVSDAPAGTRLRRSAFALGVLSTLADLPTAGPLLVATALLAETNANVAVKATDLSLYNLVYISPIVAVAIAHRRAAATNSATPGRPRTLLAWAPGVVAGLCMAGGTVIGCEGVAALM
jgi:cytochrome c biogenesis protein CcdA